MYIPTVLREVSLAFKGLQKENKNCNDFKETVTYVMERREHEYSEKDNFVCFLPLSVVQFEIVVSI